MHKTNKLVGANSMLQLGWLQLRLPKQLMVPLGLREIPFATGTTTASTMVVLP